MFGYLGNHELLGKRLIFFFHKKNIDTLYPLKYLFCDKTYLNLNLGIYNVLNFAIIQI